MSIFPDAEIIITPPETIVLGAKYAERFGAAMARYEAKKAKDAADGICPGAGNRVPPEYGIIAGTTKKAAVHCPFCGRRFEVKFREEFWPSAAPKAFQHVQYAIPRHKKP